MVGAWLPGFLSINIIGHLGLFVINRIHSKILLIDITHFLLNGVMCHIYSSRGPYEVRKNVLEIKLGEL